MVDERSLDVNGDQRIQESCVLVRLRASPSAWHRWRSTQRQEAQTQKGGEDQRTRRCGPNQPEPVV